MIFDSNENFIHKIGLLARGNNLSLHESEEALAILNECLSKMSECKGMLDTCEHESLNEVKYNLNECMSSGTRVVSQLNSQGTITNKSCSNENMDINNKLVTGYFASKEFNLFKNQLLNIGDKNELKCDLRNGSVLVITKSIVENFDTILQDKNSSKNYRHLDLFEFKDIVTYLKRNSYFSNASI